MSNSTGTIEEEVRNDSNLGCDSSSEYSSETEIISGETVFTPYSTVNASESTPGAQVTYPKNYKKRSSDFHRKLPSRNLHMRCATGLDSFLRMARSPTTKELFPTYLHDSAEFQKLADMVVTGGQISNLKENLHKDVAKITCLRAKGKHAVISSIRQSWSRRYSLSLRKVAKVTGYNYNHLWWLTNKPVQKGKRYVSTTDASNAQHFFMRPDQTMTLPMHRKAGQFFFRGAFSEHYGNYSGHCEKMGQRALSKSAVRRALPRKTFKVTGKIPFLMCKCSLCENSSLLHKALAYAGVKGLPSSMVSTCLELLCRSHEEETDAIPNCVTDATHHQDAPAAGKRTVDELFKCDLACLQNICKDCGKLGDFIKNNNPGLNMNKTMVYRQWVKQPRVSLTGRVGTMEVRVLRRGSLLQGIAALHLAYASLPWHIFVYQWQAQMFNMCKENLGDGEVLMCMDFAQSQQFERQGEIQHAFFSRVMITMHPIVCYFKCQTGCGNLVRDEVLCLTDDQKHTSSAVKTFVDKTLAHLKQRQRLNIDKVYQFSDNNAAQYKSHKAFKIMSKRQVPIEAHYFGAQHGKGPADAFIGRFKSQLYMAIRAGELEIDTSRDVYEYATMHWAKSSTNGVCKHAQTSFLHFTGMKHPSGSGDTQTIKGTLRLHCVQNTGIPYIVRVRELSCFCR